MIKYLTLIWFAATLCCCKQPGLKHEIKSKYFEGFVEFSNSYDGTDTAHSSRLKEMFGVGCFTYLGKGGFFSREFTDSNNIILRREVYRPDSLKFYYIFNDSDTIYTTNVTKEDNSVFLGIRKDTSFKILNHDVEAVAAKIYFSSGSEVLTTYYNDINYPIDPFVYKNASIGKIEEMFNHAPYLTTGYRIQFGKRVTFLSVAKKIVSTHVAALHFEIPKNKTIIEQAR